MPVLGIVASSISGNLYVASYDSIASTTVGVGGSSTISFSSIPSTYTHLQIRITANAVATSGMLNFKINGDTGNNYAIHSVNGNGSVVGANNASPVQYIRAMRSNGVSSTASIFTASVVDVLDYSNTNKYKTFRLLSGTDYNGSGSVEFESGLWLNTNAISSIDITCSSTFNQYSKFSLYGIKGVA